MRDSDQAVRWMDHILVCREPAETCTECREGARAFIRSALPPLRSDAESPSARNGSSYSDREQ